mgnify:CR=1 FL=1
MAIPTEDCRAFTGAWIETKALARVARRYFVAPSQARGLKPPTSAPDESKI